MKQEGRSGPMTPRQLQYTKRRGTMEGERWRRGNKPSLTNSECVFKELSLDRKFKLKVQGSAVSMSAQQYLPQLWVHKLISKAQSAHTSSFTDKQQQPVAFWLSSPDMVQTIEK